MRVEPLDSAQCELKCTDPLPCAMPMELEQPEEKIELVKRKLAKLPPSIFYELDANGDGYLTEDEIRYGFEHMGDSLTDPELKVMASSGI